MVPRHYTVLVAAYSVASCPDERRLRGDPMTVGQTVTRITAAFLLDQVRLGRGPLDFADALIVLTVTQANVDRIRRSPELQIAYATYDRPPPEHLRRPISINAVAMSLGLPFETVRRRVRRLTLIGACRSTSAGLVVPTSLVSLPWHHRTLEAAFDRMRVVYGRLGALGALQRSGSSEPAWTGPPPLRAAARISTEYLLRLVQLLVEEMGDLTGVAVWLEIFRSNTEHLPDREESLRADALRPVRIVSVAKRLGSPAETVRRRTAHLVALGRCEWTKQGPIAAPAYLGTPAFEALARQNLNQLQRMFAALDRLGVLSSWEETPHVAPVAAGTLLGR